MFERSWSRFRKAVKAGLARDEIREALQKAVTDGYIRGEIELKADEVWRAAISEIGRFDERNRELEAFLIISKQDLMWRAKLWVITASAVSAIALSIAILSYAIPEYLVTIDFVRRLLELVPTSLALGVLFLIVAGSPVVAGFLYIKLTRMRQSENELQDQISVLVAAAR